MDGLGDGIIQLRDSKALIYISYLLRIRQMATSAEYSETPLGANIESAPRQLFRVHVCLGAPASIMLFDT